MTAIVFFLIVMRLLLGPLVAGAMVYLWRLWWWSRGNEEAAGIALVMAVTGTIDGAFSILFWVATVAYLLGNSGIVEALQPVTVLGLGMIGTVTLINAGYLRLLGHAERR